MKLSELLMSLDAISTEGNLDVEISGVTDDSRVVTRGGLFVAVKGQREDGHAFVAQVCRSHVGGVVVQAPFHVPSRLQGGPLPAWVTVRDSRKALGQLAAQFFRRPSRALTMVGVTGTNGKTTVAHVSHALLEAGGRRAGLLGTVGYRIGVEHREADHTTPSAVPLQSLLHRMVAVGMDSAVLEVSSHALALDRVEGCEFDVVVFTNLSQDHLDFHHDMDAYYHAKRRLFRDCVRSAPSPPDHVRGRLRVSPVKGERKPKRAIINVDDDWGLRLKAETLVPVWTYSIRGEADIHATNLDLSRNGTRFTAHTPLGSVKIQSALVGEHNVSNLLAGMGVAMACGTSPDAIQEGIREFRAVPGRFERVEAGQDFSVIVDYAHTDDALAKALATVRRLGEGRILTVFGCGGDRDRDKRPKMGRVAVERSDVAFMTSDNPRTEDPESILRDVERGALDLPASRRGAFHLIPDRRAAIRAAMLEARAGDVVLIAGKGHEDYQIIGKTRYPFDDRDVARELLTALPSARKG